jgi:hypothetical protein
MPSVLNRPGQAAALLIGQQAQTAQHKSVNNTRLYLTCQGRAVGNRNVPLSQPLTFPTLPPTWNKCS